MKFYNDFGSMFFSNCGKTVKDQVVMNTVSVESGVGYAIYPGQDKPFSCGYYCGHFTVQNSGYGYITCPSELFGTEVSTRYLNSVKDRLNDVVRKYGLEFEVIPAQSHGNGWCRIEYITSPLELFGLEKGREFIGKIARKLANTIDSTLTQIRKTQKSTWNPEWDADFEDD